MAPGTRNKILFIAAKLVVSSILLYWIFEKAGIENVISHLQTVRPWSFIAAALLYVCATYLSALRWGLLLDERYPTARLFSFYMIGSFFNNLLPGIIGGDAIKVYYLYKDTKKGGSSLGSVFMDRYVGFFALLTIGLVAGLAAFPALRTIKMHWVTPALFIAFIAGSFVVFGVRVGRRFSALADFYDYYHRYIAKKRVLLKAFLLSTAVQLLNILMVFVIGMGMGQRLPLTALFVFVPIIVTIAMIPISISGFGVREGAFVVLFGMVGVAPHVSTSISFLWFLSSASASLLGLVEYLRFRRRDPGAPALHN